MSTRMISLVALLGLLLLAAFIAPHAQADGGTAVATPIAIAAQAQPGETGTSQSSLPADLGRIFAVLSIFIVTMFTMAIGTEIVVDVFKLILGIQSKPTARKTLEEYENMLPGTVSSLGIGQEAQQQLVHQLANLKALLEPVFRLEDAVVNIKTDSFKHSLDELFSSEATDAQIDRATTALKGQLRHALNRLAASLSLSEPIVSPLLAQVDGLVDTAVTHLADTTPEAILQQANHLINDALAAPLTAWTRQQIESLQYKTYAQARLEYEKLLPTLENSGLSPRTIQQIKVQIESFLAHMEKAEMGSVYLDALNELLRSLEVQRNALHSHVRRFWEWLQKHFWPRRYERIMGERAQRESTALITSMEQAAGQLLALDRRDVRDRETYVRWIRFISVVVGVALAYMLQIDAADLLADFLPESARFLSTQFFLMPTWPAISAGIILTGLGASAGSGFWHDQLGRLQAVKQTAESVYTAVQPVVVNQKLDAGD